MASRKPVYALAAVVGVAAAQGGPPSGFLSFLSQQTAATQAPTTPTPTPTPAAPTTSSISTPSAQTSPVDTISTTINSPAVNTPASSSPSATSNGSSAGVGSGSTSSAQSSPSLGSQSNDGSSSSHHGSGLTSASKIGIGVGVGVGVAVLAAIALLVFFILARRRKQQTKGSRASTAELNEKPELAAAGVAGLGGAAALGRSPSDASSNHSHPSETRTPSKMSLEAQEPADATVMQTYQHPLHRAPPPAPLVIPTAAPMAEDRLDPPNAHFDHEYAPTPIQERSGNVSPVSPVSPVSSRPPSPLHDHER